MNKINLNCINNRILNFNLKFLIIMFILKLLHFNNIYSNHNEYKKDTIYLELFGKTYLASINFDTLIEDNILFGFSIGIYPAFLFNFIPVFYFSYCINLGYLVTINKPHNFEVSLSINLFKDYNLEEVFISLNPNLGYRYQVNDGGVILRITYNPSIIINLKNLNLYSFLPIWGGFSIGWCY